MADIPVGGGGGIVGAAWQFVLGRIGSTNPNANDKRGVAHRTAAAVALGLPSITRRESRAFYLQREGKPLNAKQAARLSNLLGRSPAYQGALTSADQPRGYGFPGIGYAAWLALQPRGPRTRKRVKRKKRRRTSDPREVLPTVPWMEPGRWCDMVNDPACVEDPDTGEIDLPRYPRPIEGFTRTFPDDIPPVVVPVIRGLPGVLGGVLGGILGVLWPSEIGDEPPLPMPTQPGQPTGPRRRYRVTPRPVAVPQPQPQPLPQPAPKPRAPVARPAAEPRPPIGEPLPLPVELPVPVPGPRPSSRPTPAPGAPSPTTGRPPAPSTPRTRLPFDPWSLLPLLLMPGGSVGRIRRPGQSPVPIGTPLTEPFGYGVPSPRPGEKQCECEKPKRKKRSTCRNPITSRTTRTRGGRRYRTITRRLDCK